MTHGLCEFLYGVNVLRSCSEHKVFLADNGEQEGGKERVIERVDGVGDMLVEQLEVVCATGLWDPGVSGRVHCERGLRAETNY